MSTELFYVYWAVFALAVSVLSRSKSNTGNTSKLCNKYNLLQQKRPCKSDEKYTMRSYLFIEIISLLRSYLLKYYLYQTNKVNSYAWTITWFWWLWLWNIIILNNHFESSFHVTGRSFLSYFRVCFLSSTG